MAGPWEKYAAQADAAPWEKYGGKTDAPVDEAQALADSRKQSSANQFGGIIRGAGSIGATLMTPYDMLAGNTKTIGNPERRKAMDDALTGLIGSDPASGMYQGMRVGTEIAGTMGVGGAAANTVSRVAPSVTQAIPGVMAAVRTGGMTAGPLGGIGARTVGGAITGGLSAGLVDPEQAGTGAAIGGAMPAATKAAGAVGNAVGSGIRSAGRAIVGSVSPEVAALAQRAEQLGIKIPADRIANSKPMNAVAATLNYVPFSGRAATETAMSDGMNRALSRTFGQNSDNVTQALRNASSALGGQFDTVLQANTVQMTPAFKAALANAENLATNELGAEGASIIHRQIAAIQAKGAAGAIDGQAAYNIKKTLDRIGNRNAPEAFYARELKKSLMDALNDSLGPQQAAAFGTLRKQYGNMLALENLAQNGAEGGVSVGRLANLKNINNPDLQELADIAAQFLRTRESPHGAMQRLVIGGAAGAAGGLSALPVMAATAGAGRAANTILNSQAARNAVMGVPSSPNALQAALSNADLAQLGYRVAPNALSALSGR